MHCFSKLFSSTNYAWFVVLLIYNCKIKSVFFHSLHRLFSQRTEAFRTGMHSPSVDKTVNQIICLTTSVDFSIHNIKIMIGVQSFKLTQINLYSGSFFARLEHFDNCSIKFLILDRRRKLLLFISVYRHYRVVMANAAAIS